MTGFASTTRDARNAFVSAYPFEIMNGGLGVLLSAGPATGASSRLSLVGEGAQVLVSNLGTTVAHLAFGNSGVTATTSYIAIMPGIPYTLTIAADATHVAGITSLSTTTIQISRGYGD